jgi:hypothetical protein
MSIRILELDRKGKGVRLPRNGNPESQTDGERWMPGRKAADPEGVPSTTENEELAPDRLHGVGEQGNVDARAEPIGRCVQH